MPIEVHQLERPHREAGGAHRVVDGLDVGRSGFEDPERLDA